MRDSMAREIKENSFFNGIGMDRPAMERIDLPADLAWWVEQNGELVKRVQDALSETYDSVVSEEQLWYIVAGANSPEWKAAHDHLTAAEQKWKDLNSPTKASLGLIGAALDSAETNDARSAFVHALASFTIVNEGLRQREDLGRLLKVMMVQTRMLERSAAHSAALQQSTGHLAEMDFTRAAEQATRPMRRKDPASPAQGLAGAFRRVSEKLLGSRQKTADAAISEPSVPLSPKT